MKETQHKKMKETGVLLIVTVMVLSTVAVTADTNNELPKFMSTGAEYVLQPQQTIVNENWIHFDDGTNSGSIGPNAGGTFEGAIRITPTELVGYDDYKLTVVRWHHGMAGGDPQPPHSGNIKIYDAGTSTNPGELITSEPFTVSSIGWFEIPLSNPAPIDTSKDIWVSVQLTHNAGEYPLGCDKGPAVDGKGDWGYAGAYWEELQYVGFDINWNIWAKVEGSPETPATPDGPGEGVTGVEYTFCTSTADPEGKQVYYLWDWGDDTPTDWLGPFNSGATACTSHAWTEAETYEIKVKAKNVNDVESDWSYPKIIYIVDSSFLEIGNITGGLFRVTTGGLFRVTAEIKNSGGVVATGVDWSIILDGGLLLLDGETSGRIASIPGGEKKDVSSSLILGFGNTVVTVTAEIPESSDTKKVNAFMFLFFIKVLDE